MSLETSLFRELGELLADRLREQLRSGRCGCRVQVRYVVYPEVNQLLLAASRHPLVLVRPLALEASSDESDRCDAAWLMSFQVHFLRELPKYSPCEADMGLSGTVLQEYGDIGALDECLAAMVQLADILSGEVDLAGAVLESIDPSELFDESWLRQGRVFVGTVDVKYLVTLARGGTDA
ncbi:MAG: hypothetical protein U0795_26985 [Pirellulales bacterium]